MAHDVSLTYTRFDHMSPAAVVLTTLLHASVALALWWISPLHYVDPKGSDPIEITMEQEVQPPPTPPAPPPAEPPPAQAAAPPPPPPAAAPAPPMRLGLAPVGPSTDPKATPGATQPAPPKPDAPAAEAAKPDPPKPERAEPPKPEQAEPPKPEPPKPEQQQALAPPPPPPPPAPQLEKVLPPLEAPPPPLTSREIPRPAPPPPAPKPPPPPVQHAQPTPPPPRPPQQPALQSSPLSHPPPSRQPAEQQASRQAPTFVNPADLVGRKRVEEEYLWYVAQKISQHQQFVRNATTEAGTVVLRLTVARDGRLLDVGLSRSSGSSTLDNVSVNMIRQASPYPPLPDTISGPQHTFVLPLYFKRSE